MKMLTIEFKKKKSYRNEKLLNVLKCTVSAKGKLSKRFIQKTLFKFI